MQQAISNLCISDSLNAPLVEFVRSMYWGGGSHVQYCGETSVPQRWGLVKFAKSLQFPSNIKTHLVPQPHYSEGIISLPLADLTGCLLVPRFFIARAIIVIFLTCSTLRTIMAQDRTFFSELNCEFGAQFPEFGEAGLDQDGDRFLGAFERSDNTLNVEEDALRSSPGRVSVEPWTGLGCTCGLSFITCSEHSNLQEVDDIFLPSDVALCYDKAQPPQGVPECATIPDAPEDGVPHIDDNLPGQPPHGDMQDAPRPQKKRRTKISTEARSELEYYFARDPYPGGKELRRLSRSTKPSYRTISVWFSNSRARRKICHRK
jgi:hypothetical protein